MTERAPTPALHRSVFVRLVAIMLVMAACLLGMVSGFYFFVVVPGLHTSMDGFVRQHVRAIAATAFDLPAAQRLATTIDMDVRYEGPDSSWSTSDDMPTVESLTAARHGGLHQHLLIPGHAYYIARAPQGGSYIFRRAFGRGFHDVHSKMLALLLVLMAGVFVTAYVVLRRALRPLQWLNEGVARVSEGHFDVVVPNPTRDEFGVLTDAFNRMARRVKDMVQARDQLLLDVSHELRSPLTRLKVALELLPENTSKQGMAADVVEMEHMVAELLELERLRDRRGLLTARADLLPILREVVAAHAERPPGVRLVAAGAGIMLDFDAEKVRTVFRNLLENAIKYSLAESRAVEVSVTDGAEDVVVRVTDDGPGIPEGDPSLLFEPFFRLDPSRSKKTGGYGLGLSICKRIMEAHGGSIAVERNPGRGATFVLRFPKRASRP